MPQPLAPEVFLEKARAVVRPHLHKDRPLVQHIHRGEASRDAIGRLAIYFFHFTLATSRVYGTCYARCDDPELRDHVLHEIIDEDTDRNCGDQPHWAYALGFAKASSGLSEREIREYPVPLPIHDINNFRVRCAERFHAAECLSIFGLAAESHFPEAATLVAEGLRKHYGMSEESIQHWTVHIEGDKEHGNAAKRTAAKYINTYESQQRVLGGMCEYVTRWGYLWGLPENPEYQLPADAALQIKQAMAI
jgi:pyrroloquinoline quinone (PQQ) biosynthesis protein C